MPDIDAKAIADALANPFPADVVRFRAGATTKNGEKALALAYIDARIVMNRLDDVLGFQNWKDEYDVLADGAVRCTLSIRIGEEWIPKQDVGGQSDQSDEGDRMKAAFSDALKRAAVKFGIGRYLYDLGQSWVAYDPQRKQLKAAPELPKWAQPAKAEPAAPPAPKSLVTAEQAKHLAALATTCSDMGIDLTAFRNWIGSPIMAKCPAEKFELAAKGLSEKIAKAEATAEKGAA